MATVMCLFLTDGYNQEESVIVVVVVVVIVVVVVVIKIATVLAVLIRLTSAAVRIGSNTTLLVSL